MRTLTETGRLVAVVLLCTMASAVSQTTPEIFGGWRFTGNSISNDVDEIGLPNPGQIRMINRDTGATVKVHGKGHTGFLASRTEDSPFPPAIVMHKSRGIATRPRAPVRRGDQLGAITFKGEANHSGLQLTGALFECRATAQEPSADDMWTRCRLLLTGPGQRKPTSMMEWDPAKGMLLYGRQVVNEDRHFMPREYTRAQIMGGEVNPRPRGQLIRILDDPLHRGIAQSDGRFWRYMDGKVVN